jgi:putative membrane protein
VSAPAVPVAGQGLADGEWHRLHPASPLLRGGLVLLGVLGFIIANLRERVIDVFLLIVAPGGDEGFAGPPDGDDWAGDPIDVIVTNGLVGWALIAVAVLLVVLIVGFWLSWRMHTFRVTQEAVEVRSGILFRSHRSARLDRVQGVNVSRPVFARLFGTAKLDVSVAGQSGNVQLAYLGSAAADRLRGDVLRLASGARAQHAPPAPASADHDHPAVPGAKDGTDAAAAAPGTAVAPGVAGAPGRIPPTARAGALVGQRVGEFLAPELDPGMAPPESVVHLPAGRVVASTLLGGATVWFAIIAIVIAVGLSTGAFWVLFTFVPAAIGLVSYVWSRITKSLRYSIAGTPDGVRIGHGLLSTANQTIPPGRVHAVEATQWLLWRAFGWWSVRINLAGQSIASNNEQVQRTLVLPVGTVADVHRVLGLLLPDAAADIDPLVDAGLTGRGGDAGFTQPPRRAAWLRPFSWRRTGWVSAAGIVLVRRGSLLRRLVLVPLARMQSVAIEVGPVRRALGLASLRVHTVAGPVSAVVPVAGRVEADAAFERVAHEAVVRAADDHSERWGESAHAR